METIFVNQVYKYSGKQFSKLRIVTASEVQITELDLELLLQSHCIKLREIETQTSDGYLLIAITTTDDFGAVLVYNNDELRTLINISEYEYYIFAKGGIIIFETLDTYQMIVFDTSTGKTYKDFEYTKIISKELLTMYLVEDGDIESIDYEEIFDTMNDACIKAGHVTWISQDGIKFDLDLEECQLTVVDCIF